MKKMFRMMLMLVMNITEMMIVNKRNQFVPQHEIYGMEISSVWMFVKSTLVMSIESWHTCSLVVGVLFNGFLRMFHSLAWQQYLCDKEEMFLL
jgi:hypothetical protein